MKLTPCNIEEIGGMGYYKKSNNYRILSEFISSGLKAAKVEEFTQKSATSCAASLNASIKRYRMNSIYAIERKGEVFLIREI